MENYLIVFATILLGFAKAGFPNTAALISVPLIMQVLPANQANGVTLILMMLTDIPAALIHNRNFNSLPFKKIILHIAAGVVLTSIGWWFLLSYGGETHQTMNLVKKLVGGISLVFAVYTFFREFLPGKLYLFPWEKIPIFIWGLGIGISTAVANAAGPLMGLYLYTQGVDQKEKYTGTMAWSFLLINWIKFPCLILSGVISWREVNLSLAYILWVPLGVVIGRVLLSIVNQRLFNIFLIVVSVIMGIKLLIS